jgi:hypothetical protein
MNVQSVSRRCRIIPINSRLTHCTVLDGGTGFLKVGYAAQVCALPPTNYSRSRRN